MVNSRGSNQKRKPSFHYPFMTSPSTLSHVKFGDVAVGQRFFDPISAEYFVKQSDTMAAMVTGLGDGTIADEFEADDIVGIDP